MKMKKILISIASLALILFIGISEANAVAFDIAGPTANDVDTLPASPTVLNFVVGESGAIETLSVRLSFDDIPDQLTYWDNLFVQISHSGIDVILMDLQTDEFGANDSLIATFTDGGADLASSGVQGGLTEGTFAPQEPLSAFNGVELSGQWTLTIYDNTGYDYDGTDLLSSSIFGTARTAAPVPTLSISGQLALILAMLGIAFVLRRRKA